MAVSLDASVQVGACVQVEEGGVTNSRLEPAEQTGSVTRVCCPAAPVGGRMDTVLLLNLGAFEHVVHLEMCYFPSVPENASRASSDPLLPSSLIRVPMASCHFLFLSALKLAGSFPCHCTL